jgi:hypothetical protein
MDAILNILRPDSIGDFIIYTIFFLSLVLLVVIPEKNETPLYIVFGIIFLCVVDLLRTQTNNFPIAGFDNKGFGTFLIHIAMGIAPFIVAGMVRKHGRKGGSVIPIGLLMGFIGVLYALGSFFNPELFYN